MYPNFVPESHQPDDLVSNLASTVIPDSQILKPEVISMNFKFKVAIIVFFNGNYTILKKKPKRILYVLMYMSNFHAVKLCRCYFDEIVKDDCEEKMYFWWGVLTCSLVIIIEIIELVHSFFVLLWITLVLIPLFSIVVNWMYIYLLLYNHDKSNYREDHILPLLYVLKVENCELLTGPPSHLLLKSHIIIPNL